MFKNLFLLKNDLQHLNNKKDNNKIALNSFFQNTPVCTFTLVMTKPENNIFWILLCPWNEQFTTVCPGSSDPT